MLGTIAMAIVRISCRYVGLGWAFDGCCCELQVMWMRDLDRMIWVLAFVISVYRGCCFENALLLPAVFSS